MDRFAYRCCICDFLITHEEERVLIEPGWAHPTCAVEEES